MDAVETAVYPWAVSRSRDPVVAARELLPALEESESALTILFLDAGHNLKALGSALARTGRNTPLIGCTTAGEITPAGYEEGCAVAVSLPARQFVTASGAIDGLAHPEIAEVKRLTEGLLQSLRQQGTEPTPRNTFALLLIDGLSAREESVTSMISSALGEIGLFGGSAGDGLRFQRTEVMCDGEFRPDRAALALVQTALPFTLFKTQHFVPSDRKIIVTRADVGHRTVTEINGEPAAREYARMIGVEVSELTPAIFATSPVVVRIGGESYVRSIQRMNEDESLTFYCAIDEGIILTLASGVDLVENLKASFAEVRSTIGPPSLVLGCDCILRRLEIQRTGISDEVGRIVAANHVIGFSTYGEQWNCMHVNQTFTGVALGAEPKRHV